ncbi:MAG: DegT/DnrJ/EryC1/StrS family aminotransferase [Chloroflexi bacterium]|nr:DegT/DnrJ/EryC1/StrS family aminotransferase [Chloroflexota bacterium]
MTAQISLSSPDITHVERDLVAQVLQTPHLSMGPMTPRFEELVANFVGTRHAVAVSSGTAGLHLALIAAGIGPGDHVITTPFSFVASANCILYQGATPVFVDIDRRTLNLDVDLLAVKVRALRDTGCPVKALLPVHVFGQPCDMGRIMDIAREHGLVVVEDACEALGAEFEGQPVGTFGHAAVLAFYPNKQMTTGEGGMLVTDDEGWARLFRSLRNQGRDDDGTWLCHVRLGYNYRLDELSAALGVAQMERIEELLHKRERVAAWYTERLQGVAGVQVPYISPRTTRMSWFVYVVRLAPAIDRDAVMDRLARQGIPTRPYFPPIHLQPLYRERFGYREGNYPATEDVARRTLALPFHGNLSEAEVETVCRALEEAVGDA